MERIDIPSGFFPLRQNPPEEKKVSRKRVGKKSFFSIFDEETAAEELGFERTGFRTGDKQLESMLDEIHRLGDAIRKDATLALIRQYRKAVSRFLHVVVEQGLAVEEKSSGKNILNRKKFALVKVIDEKLERLALGILQTQRDQFDILARIDEINGLLVDLLR
ncbi:YaaR family protein [Salinispira pacifica]